MMAGKKKRKKATKKKATKKKTKRKAARKLKAPPEEPPAPDVMDRVRKRRHLFLLEKVKAGRTLAPYEVKELDVLERGAPPPGHCATQQELAAAMTVTVRTVQKWVAAGCPMTDRGFFDLSAVTAWRESVYTTGGEGNDHDAEFKRWRAARAKLEYEQLVAEVIPRAEVERGRIERIITVRDRLLGLPARLATELEGLDARAIRAVLTERMREVIASFGQVKNGKPRKVKK